MQCVELRPRKAAAPRPQAIPPRPGVLVLLHADHYLEVYASPGVRVHVAEQLAVEPPEEVLAERYLEATLPAWTREIFIPGDLAAARMPRARTAGEELARRGDLALLRALRALSSKPRPIPATTRETSR